MILFKLFYGEQKKNLSVDNYFMIGDLLEASLIKFDLRDEDLDYIYFKYENKIIILGSDELRFNDNINDLISNFDIPEYTLILKKRYTYDVNSLTLQHQINDSMHRLIYNRFKLYLQERNDKIIAERLQNEEKKSIINQSYSSRFYPRTELPFTPNNTFDNIDTNTSNTNNNVRMCRNVSIHFPRSSIIQTTIRSPLLSDSDDYEDSAETLSSSNDSINNNQEESISFSEEDMVNANTENTISPTTTPTSNSSNITNEHKNNVHNTNSNTNSNTNTERKYQIPSYPRNMYNNTLYSHPYRNLNTTQNQYTQEHKRERIERKNMLIAERNNTINRIRELERKYGIDLTDLSNNSRSSTLSSITNIINRTIGLINIHDIFNEYSQIINSSINQMNEINENIIENIPNNLLEDVKVVMSVEEFETLDDKKYIEYINSIRPDDIIDKKSNNEESKDSVPNSQEEETDSETETLDVKDRDCCSICSDDFENNSIITKLPTCRHFFHKNCIKRWLTECKNKCPLCNTNVSVNPVYY